MEMPPSPPDMKAILAQHRTRYEVPTSLGPFVLRHLPRLDADRISAKLVATVPHYADAMKELNKLTKIALFVRAAKDAAPMDENDKARLNELLRWAQPYLDEFALPCFIQPEVGTVEELNAIASGLEDNEWDDLQGLLSVLTNVTASFSAKDLAFLTRLKSIGLRPAADLTGENITVDQAKVFEEMAEQEELQFKEWIASGSGNG